VRRAALKAASRIDAPHVWPIVIAQLEVSGLDRAAQAALVAAGERCLLAIDAAFTRLDLPARVRQRLIEVLSRIGGTAAQSRLLDQIALTEWRMRLAVDAGLSGCDCQCPSASQELLWDRIDTLAATAAWALAAAQDLPTEPAHFNAIRRSLNHEIDKSIAGIFHLLASLSSGRAIDDARSGFLHGPPHQRAYALETIEQVLPSALRARVMALLEPVSAEERQKQLNRHFLQPLLPLRARLADILSSNERVGPWTAAVTLFAMTKSEIELPFHRAELAGRFDEVVVHETLAWIQKLDTEKATPSILQNNPLGSDQDDADS
jgi:hypothetical protein